MPLLDVSAKSKGQPLELRTTSKVLEGVNHFLIKGVVRTFKISRKTGV